MKDNKGLKQPKNIVYRVVMAIMAVCVPIAAYFCNYIYYVTQSDLFVLLSQLKGDTQDTGETEDMWSLHRVVKELLPLLKDSSLGGEAVQNAIAPIRSALIAFVVFFALALVLALVVFFFSCFSRKMLVPLCIAGGGLLSMIGLRISFSYIAGPLLDGTVSLGDFFSNTIASFAVSMVAKLTIFQLSTGYFIMLFLFLGMVLWAGSNMLVEAGEKPPKAPKKVK